jgi:hypothetical protein
MSEVLAVNPAQGVNSFLTPKSYVKLQVSLFRSEFYGADGHGDAPTFALAVNARRQNHPAKSGILFVLYVRRCVLTLYFGPESLTEPDFIAQALALSAAAVLAPANTGPGFALRVATTDFTSSRISQPMTLRCPHGEPLP